MPLAAARQRLLGTERPYPGQLWSRDGLRVMIVAVGPSTVTFDDLDRDERATESLDAFVSAFRRMRLSGRTVIASEPLRFQVNPF